MTALRRLIGKLLHVSQVVRPGNFFIRRMLLSTRLPPLSGWKVTTSSDSFTVSVPDGHRVVRLDAEFHADVEFWRLLLGGRLSSGARLYSPLYSFVLQPHSRTLFSDASGKALGGFRLETGQWWRWDLDTNAQSRVREQVNSFTDLSINVLELLAMVVTAYVMIVLSGDEPPYDEASVLMRGDNSSAVSWVNKCRGGLEPRSGALMRLLGVLEMRSKWRFKAKHVKGVNNDLADGISRWERCSVSDNLTTLYPHVVWCEQDLGCRGRRMCSEMLACGCSEIQLRARLNGLMRQVSGLG